MMMIELFVLVDVLVEYRNSHPIYRVYQWLKLDLIVEHVSNVVDCVFLVHNHFHHRLHLHQSLDSSFVPLNIKEQSIEITPRNLLISYLFVFHSVSMIAVENSLLDLRFVSLPIVHVFVFVY